MEGRAASPSGVAFNDGDGRTPRQGPVAVDFKRLIALDT
jgi:hypothetical protein